jgi:lysophospholipase L1-like esterase
VNYLALGDSISIDDYTGVVAGGAASQFAKRIDPITFLDLAVDGKTTIGVLEDLESLDFDPDVITLTAGGNDFLQACFWGSDPTSKQGWQELVEEPLARLEQIVTNLSQYSCPIIINTVYDPTDGDDAMGEQIGLPRVTRLAFFELNEGIRALARRKGLILSDLHALFTSHGPASKDCWIVANIEPNLAGATAIANHWFNLYSESVRSNITHSP